MRQTLLAATLVLATLPALASAPSPQARTGVLRGSECLDASYARGFQTVDDRRLLVDAGRRKYLIEVTPSCWTLDISPTIGFRGDPIFNRVCGSLGDAVLVRGSPPCRIEHMEVLDKDAYAQARRESEAWRKAKAAAAKEKRRG